MEYFITANKVDTTYNNCMNKLTITSSHTETICSHNLPSNKKSNENIAYTPQIPFKLQLKDLKK